MRRFFLLSIFVLFTASAWSQTRLYSLRGVVTCRQKPVEHARVVLKPGDYQTYTGPDGHFRFHIPAGKYQLEASYEHCHATLTLNVKSDTLVRVTLIESVSEQLSTVVINAGRAAEDEPVSQTTVYARQLESKDLSKDVPYLLDEVPSLVSYSDAGNGTGYTGLRIRGISPQQINVSINGIPLNDPESQSVYWVDVPDLASSTRSMQVQRGVGLSQFGTGAFGANINLQTETFARRPSAFVSTTYGSYNTQKLTGKWTTGLLHDHWSFGGRISRLHSDGYIDRAFADLNSYYFSAGYRSDKHQLALIHFGGHERTYQAWYGVDWETFRTNPTFNYAGAIYDENGQIIDFYDNEVDDYTQKHYQLHYAYRPSGDQTLKIALHYTKGYGYYEQYKQDQSFGKYGMTPLVFGSTVIDHTDLIRQKWLDNDFYGAISTFEIRRPSSTWLIGGAFNQYVGDHFGQVIWARFADHTEKDHIYYFNTGIKTEYNGFIRNQYFLNDQWTLFSDMQVRHVDYTATYDPSRTFDPDEAFETSDHLTFINPKIGVNWEVDTHQRWYAFFANTHREPNRTDYKENAIKPKPESLYDWETGYRWNQDRWQVALTGYYMYYLNQLVYTGKLNDVGYPIRENVGRSYRTGVEFEGRLKEENWELKSALTLSRNRNIDYIAWEDGQPVNYGQTVISYSPSVVAYGQAVYRPAPEWEIAFSSKYVGRQYMDNRNIPSSVLPAYHREDASVSWRAKHTDKERILVKLNIFNIFAVKYAANGYMWGDDAYVFPQAPRHYSLTLDIRF